MERPGRPSRHKSSTVKFPVPPSFSSDSDSEINDNDPVQVTYFHHPTDSSSAASGGASTSTATLPASQSNPEASNNMMRVSPMPLRVTLSPIAIPIREDEPRAAEPPPEPARRKRSASILGPAMASVLLDSMDTFMGTNNTSRGEDSSERPLERFQHSDYVIRPRSFCNSEYSNAIPSRPSSYKIKRNIGPIDLTPSATSRDSTCQAPVVTSSFSLRDNPNFSLRDSSTLPSNTETSQSNFYGSSRPSVLPFVIPQRAHSMDQPSTSSSILRLRQIDEMRSSSPPFTVRRRRRDMHSVRFYNEGRLTVGSHNDPVNSTPSASRNASLVDYCDLVGNFLFNHYPSSVGCSENQRTLPERTAATEPQTSSTADLINRHINTSSEVLNETSSIINDINCYLDPPEQNRNDIDGGEALEQSNDDVIMVETPERPPLPGSPDPDVVPSSRSPSPTHFSLTPTPVTTTAHAPNTTDKDQSSSSGDVPMTLCELNQTLISLLECPVCFDHATPPIFQCCKGHILCQSCHPRMTTCPICRSRLPGDRNSAMEKVAEKLMYPCKNTVTGCSLMLKLDDKQRHEDGCGFRHYACIVTSCHWKGYKPELVVHLQSNHPERLLTGTTQEVNVPLTVPGGGSMFIACHWLQSAHNEVFNVIFHVDLYKRIMKGCVIYIGSPDKADKFTYMFELKQRVLPFRTLAYSRMTHADTQKPGQPLTLSNDFSINIDMARLYRPEDCSAHILPVFVSVLQRE